MIMSEDLNFINANKIRTFKKDAKLLNELSDEQYNNFLSIINYGDKIFDYSKGWDDEEVLKQISCRRNCEV